MFNGNPNSIFLFTVLSCIILVSFFVYLIDEMIVLVATSLIGAYCTVRGLSIILGKYPDETYVTKLIMNKEFNQLGRAFGGTAMLYLVAMACLFVLGLFVQLCYSGKDKKEEAKEEKKEEIKKEEDQEHLNEKHEEKKETPEEK